MKISFSPPILKISKLSVKYLNSDKYALKSVNLEVSRGECLLILGRTGAGKTTLLLSLTRIVPEYIPAEVNGSIVIEGKEITSMTTIDAVKLVGIVFENPAYQVITLTVFDEVAFGPSNLGLPYNEIISRVNFALDATRLRGLENRNPAELSGGQQQAVVIASILAMMPPIICFDEPLSMLDPIGKIRILEVLKRLKEMGKTIITESGPDLDYVVEIADRVAVMSEGRILKVGDPHKVFSDLEVLERAGVKPPSVSEIFLKLSSKGAFKPDFIPLSIDEAFEYLSKFRQLKACSKQWISDQRSISGAPKREVIVRVRNLHYIYPNGVEALKGVNLDIYKGERLAIVGQNGAGKSTLALNLVGVYHPSNKDAIIEIDGQPIDRIPRRELIRKVNYVFQNPDEQLFCKTVREEVEYALKTIGYPPEEIKRKVDATLKLFNIDHLADESILGLTRGEKRRVAIASVVVLEPHVLIIDEPTVGLDYAEARSVLNTLKELNENKGITLAIITHDMRIVAEYTERVIVMSDGKIVAEGSPREIFSKRLDELSKLSLLPPAPTVLAHRLKTTGFCFRTDILTINEFVDEILKRMG